LKFGQHVELGEDHKKEELVIKRSKQNLKEPESTRNKIESVEISRPQRAQREHQIRLGKGGGGSGMGVWGAG